MSSRERYREIQSLTLQFLKGLRKICRAGDTDMQTRSTGALTNRKLGKPWAHIRDTLGSHRLQEGHPLNPDIKKENREDLNRMENKKRRDLYLKIRVNQDELDFIDRKFRESGMKSRSDFVRAMIVQGYIIKFNEYELKELIRLARNISGNINQIAVRANSGGRVYDDDIAEIKEEVNKLWQPLRYFQSQLMNLHH